MGLWPLSTLTRLQVALTVAGAGPQGAPALRETLAGEIEAVTAAQDVERELLGRISADGAAPGRPLEESADRVGMIEALGEAR